VQVNRQHWDDGPESQHPDECRPHNPPDPGTHPLNLPSPAAATRFSPVRTLPIGEGGHDIGADLKEQANTYAVEFTYLTRKLID
jgi:hypothetical protein